MNIPDQLKALGNLHQNGTLTDEEFARAKHELLAWSNSSSEEQTARQRAEARSAGAGFSQFWLAAKYANNLPEGPFPIGALLFLVGILVSIPVLTMLISFTMRPPNPLADALYGALVGTLCAAVPGGLGFLLMAIGWRPIRARVRLIAEGCAVLGKIDCLEVGSRKVKGGYVRFVKTLGYTFQTADGRETWSKRLSRGIPRPHNIDEVRWGDVVLVVYDPTDPSKSEFDRFDARQADRLRLLSEALTDSQFAQAKDKLLGSFMGEQTAQQLAEARFQNELTRIDREWEGDREKYYVAGQLPSVGMAIRQAALGGVVGSGVSIFAFAYGNVCFSVWGVIVAVVSVGSGISTYSRAQEYANALAAYQVRRNAIRIEDFQSTEKDKRTDIVDAHGRTGCS